MRQPKPFFRKSTNCWYLQVGKKQIRLAEDRAESFRLWHQIMAQGHAKADDSKIVFTLQRLVDLFMADMKSNSSQSTVQWYDRQLSAFLASVSGEIAVEDCRVFHLTQAVNAHPKWKANSKHNLARAVRRIFRWGRQQGYFDKDPMELAPAYRTEAREDYVTPEQMIRLEGASLPDCLDLIVLAWETGMRPQELYALEARHVDLGSGTISFPVSESKGKRKGRVVYVGSDRARGIIARQCAKHRIGPILRSSKGNPWNKASANCAMIRLARLTGIKTHIGAFRKGYCTEALKAGLDTVTVSGLMGHTNAVMVSKVYAKVQHDTKYMAEAAARAKRIIPVS